MNGIYSIKELANMLFPIFNKYNINKAVLFGSYVKGNATANSDLDILVDSGLKGLSFVGFMEDIRKATKKDVDIIDTKHIEKNSKIEKEINESGVTIYEK